MPLTQEQVAALAHELHYAEHTREPVAPLTERNPGMTLEDAYAVQLAGIAERQKAHGGRIIGWKVGLTSKAMQQMLGVDQPDFGHLLDGMRMDEGEQLSVSEMIWPRVEPEIAFLLRTELRGSGVNAADVIAATEYVIPALEVIDSRVKDWKIKLPDTIADNASCGRFVLGKARTIPSGFDLSLAGMNYYVDNNLVATATGAAVLGHPAEAVAWLANVLAPFGHYLQAGQFIMPGSLVAAVDAKAGSTIRADFEHIGSIELVLK